MAKKVDYEKRRMEILQQAIRLFLERGYENSSFGDIAKGCGMRLSSLYQYFHDKDEIIQYMTKRLVSQIRDRLQRIVRSDLLPIEKMKDVIGTIGTEIAREENRLVVFQELQRSVGQERNQLLEKIDTYSKFLRQLFYQMLVEGQERGQILVNDLESMAYALSVLVESFVFQITLNRNFSVEEHLANLFRFLDGLHG